MSENNRAMIDMVQEWFRVRARKQTPNPWHEAKITYRTPKETDQLHKAFLELGELNGWWVLKDGVPDHLSLKFELDDFDDDTTLAVILYRAEIFKSIGEAKRHGWDRPVEPGKWFFKNKRIMLEIVEKL